MKKPASNISILIERDERLQRIYTFHKKLSNGCFGHLFLVTNRLTGKKNALKVEIIVSEQRMTLPKEFQIMRKLEGVKGIPEVYNFGRTEKLMYLELQLLVRDLGSWDEKQNRVPKVCKIGHEMLHILERIHKHNIVHRDLKPQNMMLDK
jgi:casein kinase 1